MAGIPKSTNELSAPADHRQQHRLEEQLLDEAPPIRAERRADAQLALAAGAADQHHARDVQAHDQENRSCQAEHAAEHASRLRTTGGAKRVVRFDRRRLEFVRCRISLRQAGDRRRNQRIRPREVDSGIAPAVDVDPVGRPVESKIRGRAETRVPLQRNEEH